MCYPTQTIIKLNFCFGTLNNVHIKVIVYQNLSMSCFILCLFSRKFVNAFIDFPKPLIGLINGPAVGVSVTVLGLFDAVYASDKVCLYQHNSPPILQYFKIFVEIKTEIQTILTTVFLFTNNLNKIRSPPLLFLCLSTVPWRGQVLKRRSIEEI